MTTDQQKLRLADGVTFQSLGKEEEGVIVALGDGQFYSCNATTLDFLAAIDGKRNLDEIARVMHGQYDVELEELRGDLREVLGQLILDKLVIPVEG